MKGLMAKFKGAKIKQMLIAHGEKVVLGVIGLVVLFALSATNWTGDSRSPEDLYSKADVAGSKLTTGEMPVDTEKLYAPSSYQATAINMYAKLNNPEVFSPYSFGPPMSFPLHPRQKPHEEVAFGAVQHPLADYGVMVLAKPAAVEELTEEGALTAAGTVPRGRDAAEDAEAREDRDKARRQAQSSKANLSAPPGANPKLGGGPPGMEMMMGMGSGAGGGYSSGVQAKGQRYVAFRGIVNLMEIARAVQKAKNLESWHEAIPYITVEDFKIQRQKAVAGDNPWSGEWVDVSLELVDEILNEVGQTADIVESGVTDPVYTMPLPSRLDGDYTEIVSHPMLRDFQLSEEERKLEQQLNNALLGMAGEMGITEQTGKRKGFLGNTVDINGIRNSFNSAGGKASDLFERAGITGGNMQPNNLRSYNSMGGGMMRPGGMGGMGGMGALSPSMPMAQAAGGYGSNYGKAPAGYPGGGGRGGLSPSMPTNMMNNPSYGKAPANYGGAGGGKPPGMAGYMGGQMPGMGAMGGMGGQMQPAIGSAALGYLMLFRFLDFDVNPGEAYRYRVQLEFSNPNFGESLDRVKEAKVAEGETRFNDWSEPSAPVVIKPDSAFTLARVETKRAKSRGEAEFQIVQWDPELGTLIDSRKLVAKFGQFVGGLEDSERLDLGAQTLGKTKVLFSTKDFLLDTAAAPALIPSENPDLNFNIEGRQAKEAIDLPSEAIVLDEYGGTRLLDSVSGRAEMTEEEKKVKKERDQYDYMRESEGGDAATGLDAAGIPGVAGAAKGGKGASSGKGDAMAQMMMMSSSLRRDGKGGKGGKGGAAAGGYGTPPGYPGGSGGRGGRGGAAGGPPGTTGYGTAPGYPGARGGRGGRDK